MNQGKKRLKIEAIRVLPLYGTAVLFETTEEAIRFVKEQPENGSRGSKPLVRIEAQVRYKDGTRIEGQFPNKYRAVEFLQNRQEGLL